jgi:cytochrome c-type biogenesis protein CcmE
MRGAKASAAPVTRATAIKISASVLVVAAAIGFLLVSSMKQGAEYYKHVDEVTANADAWRGKRLQVHGNVVPGSIEQAKGTLLYRFKIESRAPRPPSVIAATYNGLVPDTFKDGAEVVAKGTLTADNQLSVVPDGIMAKCPSKYDADKAASPGVAQKL